MGTNNKFGYIALCFIIAFVTIVTIGTTMNPVTPRIIGGKNAPIGKYPYMASLRNTTVGSRHFCGGSIIDKRWILTAAHCAEGYKNKEKIVKVVVGSNFLDCGGDVYDTKRIIIHEGWHGKTLVNDVALIQLTQDIEYNDKVKPIKLPTEDFDKAGYPVTITGWGRWAQFVATPPNRLQEITLKIVRQCVCKRKFVRLVDINESHICTFTRKDEGICKGDSGSPLVADDFQIGIASFVVVPCAAGHPDVFARVYTYVDWIEKKMAQYKQ